MFFKLCSPELRREMEEGEEAGRRGEEREEGERRKGTAEEKRGETHVEGVGSGEKVQ